MTSTEAGIRMSVHWQACWTRRLDRWCQRCDDLDRDLIDATDRELEAEERREGAA